MNSIDYGYAQPRQRRLADHGLGAEVRADRCDAKCAPLNCQSRRVSLCEQSGYILFWHINFID